jgi:hypothetical protein
MAGPTPETMSLPGSGVPVLYKVDVFFVDDFGQGVGVPTQARWSEAGLPLIYRSIRASLTTFVGE